MPTLRKVLQDIEKVVPASWAESWDNPGLQVGHPQTPVTRIGIALDVTRNSLEMAERENCQLLISHHPLLFDPPTKIDLETPLGEIIAKAIRSGIGIVSLHTNWDVSPRGVNVCLADLLGLEETEPLQKPEVPGAWGMGAVGTLASRPTLEDFTRNLPRFWKVGWVKSYGDPRRRIERVALCGGSGGSMAGDALKQGADLFITADMKYHQIQQVLDQGLALCLVDHGEMEALSLDGLAASVTEATELPATVLLDRALPAPIVFVPTAETC